MLDSQLGRSARRSRLVPFFRALAMLSASVLVFSACSPPAADPPRAEGPPNVVLVVIDTLRADRLGSYGNPRGLTPFLDELTERGVRFRSAFAASSWTVPSVASLFTSRYASQHQVLDFETLLPDDEITLAERLAEAGYTSGGFSANPRLLARFGYGQGFQHWRGFGLQRLPSGLARKTRGPRMRRRSLAWLDRRAVASADGPFFLYVHYMEPHPPYLPPDPYWHRLASESAERARGESVNRELMDLSDLAGDRLSEADMRLLASLYDGEVAAVDGELRSLFGELSMRGILDHAVVVVTSDHGEEFKEHGRVLHGFTLYDESVRVPLLWLLPGDHGGRVVEANVSLVDVAPTLLDLLGLPPEPRFEGRSLRPLLQGQRSPAGDSEVFSELLGPPDLRHHASALVRGSLKLLVDHAGRAELYDLASDPGEHSANPERLRARGERLRGRIRERVADLSSRANPAPIPVELDDELRDALRALGYGVD